MQTENSHPHHGNNAPPQPRGTNASVPEPNNPFAARPAGSKATATTTRRDPTSLGSRITSYRRCLPLVGRHAFTIFRSCRRKIDAVRLGTVTQRNYPKYVCSFGVS